MAKSSVKGTYILDNQALRTVLKNKNILSLAPVLQSFSSSLQELKPTRRCCGGGGKAAAAGSAQSRDVYAAARRAMVRLPAGVLQQIKDQLNTRQLWIPYLDENNRSQTFIT